MKTEEINTSQIRHIKNTSTRKRHVKNGQN